MLLNNESGGTLLVNVHIHTSYIKVLIPINDKSGRHLENHSITQTDPTSQPPSSVLPFTCLRHNTLTVLGQLRDIRTATPVTEGTYEFSVTVEDG